jgi:hypothetical protein
MNLNNSNEVNNNETLVEDQNLETTSNEPNEELERIEE